MNKLKLFGLLLLVAFSSCRKDINEVDVDETTPEPIIEQYIPQINNINGNLIGFVIDENNNPVTLATVKMNNEVTTTDEYGHFFFEDKTLNSLGALVQVEKDGYFNGSRRFFPLENEQTRVKIQLLEKSFTHSFASSEGGSISIDNASVEFNPSSIQTETGSEYNGKVNVAIKWLDPSSVVTLDQMPGNLQGVNSKVEQVALGTYGMIAVELEDDNGNPLNIAKGSTAQITMSIPANLLGNAPSEIPLWSYNEEHGLWVEESKASIQNGNYVGDVSHFSFWNCDIPYDAIDLSLTLEDQGGNPLVGLTLLLTLVDLSMTCSVHTDGNGNLSGWVPANEEILLTVLDHCGETLYSSLIGPFTIDTDLGTITVSNPNINSTTVTGNLIDCDGNPVTNGMVIASYGGHKEYHYTSTSNFSILLSTCPSTNSIGVVGINLDDLEQSVAMSVPPNIDTDLGNIIACGIQSENYIIFTVDGVTKTYLGAMSDTSNNTTWIEASELPGGYHLSFSFGGVTTGDYSGNNFSELLYDEEQGFSFSGINENDTTFTSFIVTEYDTYLKATFSGELENYDGTILTVSGEINITQ